jgi:hypothetical protein
VGIGDVLAKIGGSIRIAGMDKQAEARVRERAYDDANRVQRGAERPDSPYPRGSVEALLWVSTLYLALGLPPDEDAERDSGLPD